MNYTTMNSILDQCRTLEFPSIYSLLLDRNGKVKQTSQINQNDYAVLIEHDVVLLEMDNNKKVVSKEVIWRMTSQILLKG